MAGEIDKELERSAPYSRPVELTPEVLTGMLLTGFLAPPYVSELRYGLGQGYLGESYRQVLYGRYPVRLGNVVSSIAAFLHIPACSQCAKRRLWLNRVIVWGWRRSGPMRS